MSTPQTWTWTRITDDPATWPEYGELVGVSTAIDGESAPPSDCYPIHALWFAGMNGLGIKKWRVLHGPEPTHWCHLHSDQVRETADKMRTTIETAGVRPSQKEILDFLALLGL